MIIFTQLDKNIQTLIIGSVAISVAVIVSITVIYISYIKSSMHKRKLEKELVMSLVEMCLNEKKKKLTITGLKKYSGNISVEFEK